MQLLGHFSASKQQFSSARKSIQDAIHFVKSQKPHSPAEAASRQERLDQLNDLLNRTKELESQANDDKKLAQSKVKAASNSGQDIDAQTASTAASNLNTLTQQANSYASQAGSIMSAAAAAAPAVGGAMAAAPPPPALAPAPAPAPVVVGTAAPAPAAAPQGAGNGAAPAAGSAAAPPTAAGGAAAGAAAPVVPTPAPNPQDLWYEKLKMGLLQHSIPATMDWRIPTTITATISGANAPPTPLPGATGQARIKTSTLMVVEPSCPDNPGEFTFTPEAGTPLPGPHEAKYVPVDGTTTWQWSVLPKYTGKQQKITIQAWVVYPNDYRRELPVYTGTVNVDVPDFWTIVKRLIEGDPKYWLNYGLPGGAGFVFMSGILSGFWAWIRNRKKRDAAALAAAVAARKKGPVAADEPDFGG